MEIWCPIMTRLQPHTHWESQRTTVPLRGSPPTGSGNASERGGWFLPAEWGREIAGRTLPQSSGILSYNDIVCYCFIRPAATAITLSFMTDTAEWTFSKRCLKFMILFALPHCGIWHIVLQNCQFDRFLGWFWYYFSLWICIFIIFKPCSVSLPLTSWAYSSRRSIFILMTLWYNVIYLFWKGCLYGVCSWAQDEWFNNTIVTAIRHDCGMNNCVE